MQVHNVKKYDPLIFHFYYTNTSFQVEAFIRPSHLKQMIHNNLLFIHKPENALRLWGAFDF